MSYDLSILICSLEARAAVLQELLTALDPQADRQRVETLVLKDAGALTIGAKRQRLLEMAKGRFVAFVDDDDLVPPTYVGDILGALAATPDATHCSLKGLLQIKGKQDEPFEHSSKYTTWEKVGPLYIRPPNHLNTIRRDIALKIDYPAISWGEDKDFSMRLSQSGLLGAEAEVARVLYYYRYNPKK